MKTNQRTIFIIDDNETNLVMARDALMEHYRVLTLTSAAKMFTFLEKVRPDLILLDIKMPDIDGFEALKSLKENDLYKDIPVIFLTNLADAAVEAKGFQQGVVDFITKPFSGPVLLNRLKTHLDIDSIIRERTQEIVKQKVQLQKLQNSIVHVVADMVEKRDHETGGHIERTTAYIELLLESLLKQKTYMNELRDIDFDMFVSSARLHDVGKITISDTILNKPGKLTDEEFEIMKTHAKEGEMIIDQISSRAGNEIFLSYAKLFAGYHHERWDGRGYPYGEERTDIPIHGRIMAFADVYDALISNRPYKKAFTHAEAMEIIKKGAGTQFDPLISEVFQSISDRLEAISAARQ